MCVCARAACLLSNVSVQDRSPLCSPWIRRRRPSFVQRAVELLRCPLSQSALSTSWCLSFSSTEEDWNRCGLGRKGRGGEKEGGGGGGRGRGRRKGEGEEEGAEGGGRGEGEEEGRRGGGRGRGRRKREGEEEGGGGLDGEESHHALTVPSVGTAGPGLC